MSRTKRDVKHIKSFRKLKTSPHQLNKQLVEKKGDKVALYACDDFEVAALDELIQLNRKFESDGTYSVYHKCQFLVNLTKLEYDSFDWSYYFPKFKP